MNAALLVFQILATILGLGLVGASFLFSLSIDDGDRAPWFIAAGAVVIALAWLL